MFTGPEAISHRSSRTRRGDEPRCSGRRRSQRRAVPAL